MTSGVSPVPRVRRGVRWRQILSIAQTKGRVTSADLVQAGFIREEHRLRQHYASVILQHHFNAGRLRRVGLGVYEVAPHEITVEDRALDGGVWSQSWVPSLDQSARERLLGLLEKTLGPAVRSLVATATGKAVEDVLAAERFIRFLAAEREKQRTH